MLEGFVSQVLLGYLGGYVKGIQKDQLKIGLWREEVLLEKVELIPEAFDYLQLPFAFKTGQVGKLSIKIPWKKLGRESIVVALEDVFICTCQREDNEWSSDFVEKRELGGKLAKLNAIELTKFSKRVSDNPAGRSFLSFIYAKVLDNIQISIKNVHVIYVDSHSNEGTFMFGLRLSTLTIMTESQKQNATVSAGGKVRTGQVNKKIEISKFGFYCNSIKESPSSLDGSISSLLCPGVNLDTERYDYLINPFDAAISLSVNKSGKLDCAPQYSIVAEVTALVLSLNDVQLRQMLGLVDYFSICLLRERYGRYRPSQMSLSKKLDGWQRMWWNYAQESVLSDVRRKLRKTSWNNFSRRISQCRRYVNLYKRKLELLNQEQLVNKDIHFELEKMDKEYDIDDILDFRCIAEEELQEHTNSSLPTMMLNGPVHVQEEQQLSDQSERRARGWLNWLSLGMLGAGGTADSSSFAGAVSDEIIKDIYDATEFHPLPLFSGDSLARNKTCMFSMKLNIGQVVSRITTGRHKKKIANAIFNNINVETNVWEDSVAVLTLVGSVKIINTLDDIILSPTKMEDSDESSQVHLLPFIDIQIRKIHPSQNPELSIKIMIQPLEATYVSDFFQDLIQFCDISTSFESQQMRVLCALNGFRSFKSRVLSKKEYISSNRMKLNWHISLEDAVIKFPLKSEDLDNPILAIGLGGLSFKSDFSLNNVPQMLEINHSYGHSYEACMNGLKDAVPSEIYQDLYDRYNIDLTGFEVYILYGSKPGPTSVIDKINALIGLELCIFVDEPMLKALKVNCSLASVELHLTPTSVRALVGIHGMLLPNNSKSIARNVSEVTMKGTDVARGFQFSVSVYLVQLSLNMCLTEGSRDSSVLCCTLFSVYLRYSMQKFPECSIYVKLLKADEFYRKEESGNRVILSSTNDSCSFTQACAENVGLNSSSIEASKVGCLSFKYHAKEEGCILKHEICFSLSDIDLHIYPKLFGLLQGLLDSLNSQPYSKKQDNDSEAVDIDSSKFGLSKNIELTVFTHTQENHFPIATMPAGISNHLESWLTSSVTTEMQSLCGLEQQLNIQTPKIQRKLTAKDYATKKRILNAKTFNVYLSKIKLNDLHIHFHDSSCILGTISLSKSSVILSCDENECLDAHISTKWLTLSSCWLPPNIHKQLWGPASPDICPVFDIHVRKQKDNELVSATEIKFVIQHVCCILPSSFLSVLIGYFSLPDWIYDNQLMDGPKLLEESFGRIQSNLSYKFEILHSKLLVPIENLKNFCPQLELPELCISFILASKMLDSDKNIPSCCALPANTNVDHFDIIDVFGRTCSFSLMPLNDDTDFVLKSDECSFIIPISLMEQLDVDIWIRVPCITMACAEQSPLPALIMMKLYNCNLFAEEKYLGYGAKAISSIIDEMTLIGEESKLYTCDLSQFLIIKKVLREINASTVETPNNSFFNLKMYTEAISIRLSRCAVTQSTLSEMVAKADLQFNLVSSVKGGILQSMEVGIPSLILRSHSSNLLLASFVSDVSIGSSLCINFFQSNDGNKQISVEVPFLDIWLHFLEWDNIIDALCSYSKKSDITLCSFHENQESMTNDFYDSYVSPCSLTNGETENVALTVRFESSRLAIHIPIYHKDNHASFEQNEASANCKYVQISLVIRYCEFTECGHQLKLKCIMKNIRTILEISQGQNIRSFPFIQISQIKFESSAHKVQELMHFIIDVQLESADIEFSYQILKYWSFSQLILPDRSSSSYRHPSHTIICHVQLVKASVLLSDGRWSYHGPMFEISTKNTLMDLKLTHDTFEGSVNSDFFVNYNNIDKVMWESFIEPCRIHLNLVRKTSGIVIMNTSPSTNLYLQFTSRLNLNITEPLIEAMFRVNRMVDDAFNQNATGGLKENHGMHGFQSADDDVHTQRYAPYILQNDTSLPFTYHISRGSNSSNDILCIENEGNVVQPGHAVPIFVEELDEQYFHRSSAYSSERLIDKKINSFPHHMISIQLEGTTGPSKLMSMDVVGLNYFEVNFAINNKQSDPTEMEDVVSGFNLMSARSRVDQSGLVVPVVFEVSTQHYSKMIRVYSTVILSNATSMPLELRFDIPFGFSPKVLDPILPGQEIPLPLHLAEAGQIRWRPLGNKYLWSEAHSVSNIVSQEYRLKFLRSFVCYPVHPTCNPFRCCISIQDYGLSASNGEKKQPFHGSYGIRRGNAIDFRRPLETGVKKNQSIHLVKLTTPLLVKNYLPVSLSLMIESGGVAHTISVKEVDVVSVSLVESTNDLGITFHMQGYRPVVGKFPRAESFSSMAKLNGSMYYVSETLALYPETSSGPTHVTFEKAMDASSGAREICLYAPFLVYNCTGLVLSIVDSIPERKGNAQVIPSCYNLIEHEQLLSGKQGLPFLLSEFESCTQNLDVNSHTVSIREKSNLNSYNLLSRNFHFPSSPGFVSCGPLNKASLSKSNENANCYKQAGLSEVKPHMYSPTNFMHTSESIVKICAHTSYSSGNALYSIWSNPFSLLPASGSINVNIPKPNGTGAFLMSATSIPITGELTGRSSAIIFQPRYVICNTCNKDLWYKQKGTNDCYRLSSGQHSHLHLSDTSRELYVSIRFNEPGSQWSGSFLPDCLSDVQVKIRNYVSGRLHMVRVEIQNAGMASNVENTIKNANGISSTRLILLSDDNTGYMPYRIDNFSMERLRVYQQRCEFFETVINSYSSTQYAWDEPCNPHRLVIEVPGERILGIYTLDCIQDHQPIYLPSTAEKGDRRLFVSVHEEGAIKVLSIIDSNYHLIKDEKEIAFVGSKESQKTDKKLVLHANYSEIINIHIPFIGISLINSSPQELLFVSARDSTISVMQSLDEQRLSFQILNLQIDNQFFDTPYPIMLSFNNEHRGSSANFLTSTVHASKIKNDNDSPSTCNITNEYVFYFSAAKWRNEEASLVSFKYISLRLAPLYIELEEQVLLSMLEFFKSVSARLQRRNFQRSTGLHNLDTAGNCLQLSAAERDHGPICRGPNNMDSYNKNKLLPSIIPIGAPWQNICLSARRQKKIYIELFEVTPIKFSLSFTSTPWIIRNEGHAGVDNITHISSSTFLRSLMALVDVEEVPVHLGELVLGHLMASRTSVEEIITAHYTRQLLHEMYKIFGSAGVIGNPIGFARNVGLGIRDFLSVSKKENVWSPVGLLNGIKHGSKSLITNTVYAISSATSQFTKTAHKGMVALTFDEQAVAEMDTQHKDLDSHGKGILGEFLEGLTGLLQSPIRGAERHGLPGVLSGIAMGTAGVVARPMASILEATGKTAQNIRKRSSPHQANRLRIRFPRPLARELPLLPYSWEEAIGVSMLLQADRSRLRDETLIMCKSLKQPGKFNVISEKHIFSVFCSSLVNLGSPQFAGVSSNPEWVIEMEMEIESIVHIDRTDDAVNIVGSNAESSSSCSRQKKGEVRDSKRWKNLSASLPLVYVKLELRCREEAEDVLRVLLSMIDQGKERRQGKHLLHRSNLR